MNVSQSDLMKLADDTAKGCGLDPVIVKCIVEQESRWDPWAWNPEPKFHYFVDVRTGKPFRALTAEENASEKPPQDFHTLAGDPDQEWWAQQASWGLMQVMGAVAREVGFKGPYLPKLSDPETNLYCGCQYFLRKLHGAGQDVAVALLHWNGNKPNSTYAAEVLARRNHYA